MKLKETLSNCFFAIKRIRILDKKYFILKALDGIMSSFMPVVSAFTLKYTLDYILGDRLLTIFIVGGIFLSITIFLSIFLSIIRYYESNRLEIIKNKIAMSISLKCTEFDLDKFDDTDYHDRLMRVAKDAEGRYLTVYDNVIGFIKSLITLLGLFVLLLMVDVYIIIAVAIFVIVSLITRDKLNKNNYNKYVGMTGVNRIQGYIKNVFKTKVFEQEQKIFNYKNELCDKFNDTEIERNSLQKKYNRKAYFYSFLSDAIGIMLDGFIIMYLGYKVYIKDISAGDFVAMMSSLKILGFSICEVFLIIPTLKNHSVYIKDIRTFMNMTGKIETTHCEKTMDRDFEYIEFNNVSFKYRGANINALEDISFKIMRNEKIGLVGDNGAGKTTLTKLLTRLYSPTEGNIFIDGININELNVYDYRNNFSMIFQNFLIIPFGVKDNLCINDEKEALDALENVGLKEKVLGLVNGINTSLSRELDKNGTEFSGGEKQLLAIARAISKKSSIIVLDEASSSLDPITENKINELFMRLFKDQTMIIISHRLSMTKHCNRILVLEKGKIIQEGSHEQLLKQTSSKYYNMWNSQVNLYE